MSARQAILDHVHHWNAMDKEAWLALFADEVLYEDPPGTVASQGKQVMSDYAWDGSFTDVKRWILEPVKIIECGNEAQVYMRNHGTVAGMPAWAESIELYRVNEAGLIDSLRAFWELPTAPAVVEHMGFSQWNGGS